MAILDDVPHEVVAHACGLLLAEGDPGDRALAAEALACLMQEHGPGVLDWIPEPGELRGRRH